MKWVSCLRGWAVDSRSVLRVSSVFQMIVQICTQAVEFQWRQLNQDHRSCKLRALIFSGVDVFRQSEHLLYLLRLLSFTDESLLITGELRGRAGFRFIRNTRIKMIQIKAFSAIEINKHNCILWKIRDVTSATSAMSASTNRGVEGILE